MSTPLPSMVHVSRHPCLQAKLSLLRSAQTGSKETKVLVHDITTILAMQAFEDSLTVQKGPETGVTPLGDTYEVEKIAERVTLIPILRSGLAMTEAVSTLLPTPCPIHHLGLFRDKSTLAPVEYYNNLPDQSESETKGSATDAAAAADDDDDDASNSPIAIILDPILATGGTISAAIQTALEWGGAKRIIVMSCLATRSGLEKVAGEIEDWKSTEIQTDVQIWVGGVDPGVNDKGMIVPGIGDVGDRLFLAIGK